MPKSKKMTTVEQRAVGTFDWDADFSRRFLCASVSPTNLKSRSRI
jgi:hypothetical protein